MLIINSIKSCIVLIHIYSGNGIFNLVQSSEHNYNIKLNNKALHIIHAARLSTADVLIIAFTHWTLPVLACRYWIVLYIAFAFERSGWISFYGELRFCVFFTKRGYIEIADDKRGVIRVYMFVDAD